jgi:hypothetical protein
MFVIKSLGLLGGHGERVITDAVPVEIPGALSISQHVRVASDRIHPGLHIRTSTGSLAARIDAAKKFAIINNWFWGTVDYVFGISAEERCILAPHISLGMVVERARFIRGFVVECEAGLGVMVNLAIRLRAIRISLA